MKVNDCAKSPSIISHPIKPLCLLCCLYVKNISNFSKSMFSARIVYPLFG